MQSEQVEVRASLPTLASLDEEFGGANKQVVPEQDYQPNRPRRRYVWFLLASAVLAVTSAVIWPNALQLWSFAQSLPSSSAEQIASPSSAGSAEQFKELDSLKKGISELRDWQQQISAEITVLQSAHQELQRSSVKAMSWYSEPNALRYQRAAPKPRAAALRNRTAPLPLVRSQTTAPDAVPIR
jgi:TolA-binding protein